jgi:F-type H+-transporting ATPase subunit a
LNITDAILFYLGPIPITSIMMTTWVIMGSLIVLGYLGGRLFKNKSPSEPPKGIQNAVEILVESINNLVKDIMGEDKIGFAPYIGTICSYLLIANLLGLIGYRPPTSDLNTTGALGILTFIAIHFNGIKAKGIKKYLKGYAEPYFVMLPLNIISDLAIPISLSFRLFGNILAGYLLMSLLYMAMPFILPVPFHAYFDLFSGVLQTFIFIMLTMVFISMKMDD